MDAETDSGDSSEKRVAEQNSLPAAAARVLPFQTRELVAGNIVAERYRVLELIGQGGMGAVYRVEQIYLKREFALKTIHSSNVPDIVWRRFQKEAQAAGLLDHPGLTKVHDFGMIDEQQPFFIMDLIEGETMDRRLKSGPLPIDFALDIFIKVAVALGYAHEKGVIHRDIKPDNLMLYMTDQRETGVKILDFGIAKLVGADSELMSLTKTGDVFGTPFYMSPEQCLGTAMDARADVYAFGCVLFEALTGQPPFIADSALSIMMKHQSTKAPTLKEGSLGKVFNPSLEQLVAKLLEKEPRDRYQTMVDVVADLERIKVGEAVDTASIARQKVSSRSNAHLYTTLAASGLSAAIAFFVGHHIGTKESRPAPLVAAPEHPPEVVAGKNNPPLADGYFSEIDGDKRVFHFPTAADTPGIIVLRPPGMTIVTRDGAGNVVDAKDYAIGDLTMQPFKPFGLSVGEYLCDHPAMFKRFRADELSTLDFKGSYSLADSAFPYMTHLQSVQWINLDELNQLTDAILPSLDKFKNLKILNVSRTGINGTKLAELKCLRQLETLNLRSIPAAPVVLGALRGATATQDLNLRLTNLIDADVPALAAIPNLVSVDLSSNFITDKGLASLQKLKHLKVLNLSKCRRITPACAEYLRHMPSLQVLAVDHWMDADQELFAKNMKDHRISISRRP